MATKPVAQILLWIEDENPVRFDRIPTTKLDITGMNEAQEIQNAKDMMTEPTQVLYKEDGCLHIFRGTRWPESRQRCPDRVVVI